MQSELEASHHDATRAVMPMLLRCGVDSSRGSDVNAVIMHDNAQDSPLMLVWHTTLHGYKDAPDLPVKIRSREDP